MRRYGQGPNSLVKAGKFFSGAKMIQQDLLTEQLLSKDRQFVFVSSMLPGRHDPNQQLAILEELTGKDLKKIIAPGSFKISETLKHTIIGPNMKSGKMYQELELIIKQSIKQEEQVLVFVQNRDEAENLRQKLEVNYPGKIESFTSYKTASFRIQIIQDFKAARIPILIAASFAQRGFEFPKLKTVVQWNFAKNQTEFINRVGRVGRRGKPGHAISFIRQKDLGLYQRIKELEQRGYPLQEPPLI